MTGPVVECVPNFSEGTDARRVEAIVASMRVEGVHLLDWSMDNDHNRSVVTLAGEPAAIVEAAVRGVGKAVDLIDLTRQQGVHPGARQRRADALVPLVATAVDRLGGVGRIDGGIPGAIRRRARQPETLDDGKSQLVILHVVSPGCGARQPANSLRIMTNSRVGGPETQRSNLRKLEWVVNQLRLNGYDTGLGATCSSEPAPAACTNGQAREC